MAEHRWSGWPGAYCLDCGAKDPREIAMADGSIYFDCNRGEECTCPTANQWLRCPHFGTRYTKEPPSLECPKS